VPWSGLKEKCVIAERVVKIVGLDLMDLTWNRQEETPFFYGMPLCPVQKHTLTPQKVMEFKLRFGMGVAAAMPLNHPPFLHLEEKHDIKDLHGQLHCAFRFPKGQGLSIITA
jgi:hypothetical protein